MLIASVGYFEFFSTLREAGKQKDLLKRAVPEIARTMRKSEEPEDRPVPLFKLHTGTLDSFKPSRQIPLRVINDPTKWKMHVVDMTKEDK